MTLPIALLAASIIAMFRNLDLESREDSCMAAGAAVTASSTDSANNRKLADFQFHFSSVRDGAFRVVTWQSTVMSMGMWSDPRHSVVLHSTRSNQLLWTRVTSGALLPPVPGLVLVAAPSFAMQKSFSISHSSRFDPRESSGCHLSHIWLCAFRSPPVIAFRSWGSSDISNSLPWFAPLPGGSRRWIVESWRKV